MLKRRRYSRIPDLQHFTLPNGEQVDLTDAKFVVRVFEELESLQQEVNRLPDLRSRLEEVQAENAELEAIFYMQHKREVELWQQWREQGKIPPNVQPDYGKQLLMLLEERDQAQSKLAVAEREREEAESFLAGNFPDAYEWRREFYEADRLAAALSRDLAAAREHVRALQEALEEIADRNWSDNWNAIRARTAVAETADDSA